MSRSDAAAGIHARTPVADQLVAACIAVALLGSAWLLDPFAEAGFDAPKRLSVLIAAAIGGAAVAWQASGPAWRRWSWSGRTVVLLLLLGIGGLVFSTIVSPHRAQAAAALRCMALFGLFLPMGASRALSGASGRRLLWIAAAAVGVNLVLSLLQAGGVLLPIPLARLGGRFPTGALLGNEAYVALAGAFLAATGLAFALRGARGAARWLALALGALGIGTIIVNRQLTSAIALLATIPVILAVHFRCRWIIAAAAGVTLITASIVAVPSLRNLVRGSPSISVETMQHATTYRLGAWAAAAEMVLAKPLTGYGPGTYGAESQLHRLAAELRWHERLLPPPTATTFVYAHQDYLQLAAEAGIPTLLAFLGALGLLIIGTLRLAAASPAFEPLGLAALLIAGAIAALAWFPMQIPFTATVLLLGCGRAWRLIADSTDGT